MRDEDWEFYQGRIESLARRLGMAEASLRILARMVAEGDSRGNLTRYIENAITRMNAEELAR